MILESEVQPNFVYKTLFYGLRRNHPHNVAVLHPLLFCLRRVLYAVAVIFLVGG